MRKLKRQIQQIFMMMHWKRCWLFFSWIWWLICKSLEIEKWFNAHFNLRLAGHHNNVAHFILSITFLGQFSRRQRGAQRVLRTIPSGETIKYLFHSLHSPQQNSFVIYSRGKAQYNWPLGFLHEWSLSLLNSTAFSISVPVPLSTLD